MKNFMNFVGIMLGAVMLCDKATDENYNFEAGMKKQEEKDGKVEASAVTEAKKQMNLQVITKLGTKSIQNLQTRKMTLSQKRKKKSLVQDTKISIFNQHPNSKCFYAKQNKCEPCKLYKSHCRIEEFGAT